MDLIDVLLGILNKLLEEKENEEHRETSTNR